MACVFRNQLHFYVATANSKVPKCAVVIFISVRELVLVQLPVTNSEFATFVALSIRYSRATSYSGAMQNEYRREHAAVKFGVWR